ncbi:autotransporter outer membrane beta-barrel domain-containing protein [Campylobacter sp. RM12651]|uniref:autotransporter outer membrane beta-barrel domain-containing protein n=1 Tax=Campylobacter sp. RM12651 TaxID=1660079 RepID=UPI001EFBF4A1|nr:autotransporter outer membrane beta-barrel domain-containing protein [Campylobacter sp. RM12651]ULO02516.1 autotransporter domain-containing protein [Campylobacter sp. RM12651]
MKNIFKLSIVLTTILYSYDATNIVGDLTKNIDIKQTGISSIKANKIDDSIYSTFVINGTLTTNSIENKNLIFDYKNTQIDNKDYLILVSGGNFTDNGSIFISQGNSVFSNNIEAIKIKNNGIVTLINSSVYAGNADRTDFQFASAILIDKGTLNLNNSLVEGGYQRGRSYQAINARSFGTDKTYLNISGSIIKAGDNDIKSTAIMANQSSTIIIDDTKNNKGSSITGYINTDGDFTIKGIYKNNSNFIAKSSNTMNATNNTFDTIINSSTKTNLGKNANIDKAYIGGGLDLNKSSTSTGTFIITNSYIKGDIVNSDDIRLIKTLKPTINSKISLDNVYLDGALNNYSGEIKSSNSVFNKIVKSEYVSKIDDTNSIFKGGFSADEIILNKSTLEGFKLPSISDAKYSAKNFNLTNTKVGKDINTKGYLELMGGGVLKATNSALNFDIKSNNSINIDLTRSSLVGSFKDLAGNKISANKISLNNSTSLGAFSTNELIANNSTFFLGGTNTTYNGAIISKISTSGANNNFGIIGVVSKDTKGNLIANNLSVNLPLAILKGANNDFATNLKFYSGISEYALANSYLKSEKVGDYQVYVLAKDNKQSFNDLTYKNNSKLDINKINEIVANSDKIKDLVDFNDNLLASNEAKELINQNTDKSLENKGTMIKDFDNKSIPWIDLKPANPIKPTTPPNIEDTKPSEPEIKPDIKPEVTPETPINPNENIKPNPNEEAKPEIKPSIPWIDLKPANPIKPSEPKTDEEKFEIALEEQKEAIKLMVTGKNEKALESAKLMTSQFYFSQVFEYNNLNKRLGELRSFTNNAGIWIRGYINKGSIKNTSIKANEIQLGADKIINNNDFDTYAGIMLNIGKTTTDNTTNSKINNYGFGVYFSNVYNNGFFLDATLKTNHYKSEFRNDTFLGNSTSKGTGIIASAELGYRFGDEFYLEPSLELIANYIPKTDIKGEKVIQFGNLSQVSNVNITSSSKVLMVSKAAVYTGVDINNTTLRAGIGGIFDLTNNPDFLVSDGISSFAFSGAKKDKRGFASIGLNKNISKKLGLNIEAEKTFSGNLNIDYNINASIRFEF